MKIVAMKRLAFSAMLVASSCLYAPFGSSINYSLLLTEKSSWGVNDYTGAPLQDRCKVDALKAMSIVNNQGKAGLFVGTTSRFLLCPSLDFGVKYWNPLAVVNTLNPCYTETFSPLTGKKIANNCKGITAMLADGSGWSRAASSFKEDPTTHKLQAALEEKYGYVSEGKKDSYKQLYDTINTQLTFLSSLKDRVNSLEPGENFYSVPYLKFCSLYNGTNAVTSDELNKLSEELFGKKVDVSAYFPEGTFTMSLDLTVGSQSNGVSAQYAGHKSSSKFGGVLARAVEAGLLKNNSAQELLEKFGTVAQKDIAEMINKYAQSSQEISSIVADRALLQEAFFAHVALTTGLQVTAEIEDQTAVNLNDGFLSMYKGAGHQVTPSELSTKLFNASRYVRGINTIPDSGRTAFNPQPVDTFYGAVVINEGTYQDAPVSLTTGMLFMGGVAIGPNSAGILPVVDGVDSWNVAGINEYSGLKYRSVPFTVTQTSGEVLETSMELQIDEGKGGKVYGSQSAALTPAGITLVDTLNNIRTTITITPLIEQFFKVAPTAPWGVIVQVVNEKNRAGQVNPQPSFKPVGLVRFNPLQFPLTYVASDLSGMLVRPFTVDKVLSSPFKMYSQIAALKPVAITPDKVDVGQVAHNTVVTITPTNVNYAKYKGALGYKWGAEHSMQDAFKGSMQALKTQFLTKNKLTNEALLSLVKAADSSNDAQQMVVKTAGKTFELFSIAAKDSL